jgi:hypothetical protein
VHKIGLALTVILGVIGLWDYKAFFESELVEQVGLPLLGLVVLAGFMKYALNRA